MWVSASDVDLGDECMRSKQFVRCFQAKGCSSAHGLERATIYYSLRNLSELGKLIEGDDIFFSEVSC